MRQENIKSWDPIWEDIFSNQNWGRYPGESLIQFVARNFYKADRPKTRLLEIGCGPGANIWYLSRENFDVTGIDGSQTAIGIARKRLKEENYAANLIVGDIITLPFEDNYFDGIIDVECLYANNRTNTETILGEIKRVLATNGLFYSRTFAEDMFLGKTDKVSTNFEFSNIQEGPLAGKGFVRLINKNEIENLYGKYFKLIAIDKLQYTIHNGLQTISEYIIICKNE